MDPGQHVVLVDADDHELGTMEKLEAHRRGLLHRAFSVFLFDGRGHMLLQRRAAAKYHSAGLWSNACCSHPPPGMSTLVAARHGLMRELGIATDLTSRFSFTYKADVGGGLTEHELDHVFFGRWDGPLEPNPAEVMDTRWVRADDLEQELAAFPDCFTPWLRLCWPQVHLRWPTFPGHAVNEC